MCVLKLTRGAAFSHAALFAKSRESQGVWTASRPARPAPRPLLCPPRALLGGPWLSVCRCVRHVCCLLSHLLLLLCVCVQSLSRVRLCDPTACGPPGTPVHGILQTRRLAWVALSSSRAASQPRHGSDFSRISCAAGGFLTPDHCGRPPVPWRGLGFSSLEWASCFTVTTHVNHRYRQCVGKNSDLFILPVNRKQNI